jgi:hypothetical protein
MSSLSRNAVPLHRNPALRPGLSALATWLMESSYTAHAVGRIFDFTAAEGTPTGCPELAPEDEAAATAVFCDALDAVPYNSPAWDDESVILDTRMMASGTHPFPCGPEPDGPDAPDAGMSRSAALGELIRTGSVRAMPPLGGGSPDAAPFEPSEADWDDYSRWSRELDRRYAAAEASRIPTAAEMRAWYDANEDTRPDFDA